MRKIIVFILFFIFFNCKGFSQISFQNNFVVAINLSFSFGTHVRNIGVNSNLIFFYKNIQFSTSLNYIYFWKNFGPLLKYPELQINFSSLVGLGKNFEIEFYRVNYFSNLLNKEFIVAYSYNLYFNKIETSQRTGTIFFQYKNFKIFSENDIFAQQAVDKFRTAAIKIEYSYFDFDFAISSVLWTGETKGVPKITNTNYPSRFGYKNLSEAKYGKFSHGILVFEISNFYNFQYNKIAIGIDSEYVRHFLQNILIHDMFFFPAKWNKAKNPHYPMLLENGNPYLFLPEQRTKKVKLCLQYYNNPKLFY